jgi:hypothetical protein
VLLGGAVALLPVYASEVPGGAFGLDCCAQARDQRGTDSGGGGALSTAASRGAAMLGCVADSRVHRLRARNVALSTAALVAAGACDMVSVIIRHTLVQLRTPNEMRGRVSAVNMVFIGASNELGQFESGLTAHWFGVVPAALLGGAGTIAIVALWTALFPALRKVEKFGRKRRELPAELLEHGGGFGVAELRGCARPDHASTIAGVAS